MKIRINFEINIENSLHRAEQLDVFPFVEQF